MSRKRDKNILVISDLHLGEDLKGNVTPASYLRRLVHLERELGSFLDHYRSWQLDGRPWTLVINGDMVDFMSVMILPDAPTSPPDPKVDEDDAEDRLYGLGFGPKQSQRKLDSTTSLSSGTFRPQSSLRRRLILDNIASNT